MISDILREAKSEIDRYLAGNTYKDMYKGNIKEIKSLLKHIEKVRRLLDMLPKNGH